MFRYLLLVLVFVTVKIQSQNQYKSAEGHYSLSGFEIASGIYLIKNKKFFYYATFGAVDLKVYGSYKINNNGDLTLYPDKELLKEFYIYGSKDVATDNTIKISYYKPYDRKAEKISIISDNETLPFPEFASNKREVSLTFKRPVSDEIKKRLQRPKSTNLDSVLTESDTGQ